MSTPHISAEKGDFAKTVLMPGDPLRAKFIADTFLKDVRQVTGVRGMLGFTGTYEGRPISVTVLCSDSGLADCLTGPVSGPAGGAAGRR